MHFFSFPVSDYTAQAAHLEPIEDLAYRRMMDLYIKTEMPLSKDPGEVSRLIRLRDHIQTVSRIMEEFFVEADDGWHHAYCDREIERYRNIRAQAKARAKWIPVHFGGTKP